MDLKLKKVLLVGYGTDNEEDFFMYQGWYLTLKNIFPDFDSNQRYKFEGKAGTFKLIFHKTSLTFS